MKTRSICKILLRDLRQLLLSGGGLCCLCGGRTKPAVLPWRHPLAEVESCFCSKCLSAINWVKPPKCTRCGRPLTHAGLCRGCAAGNMQLQGGSLAVYDGSIRQVLLDLKFKGRQEVATPLGYLLAEVVAHVVVGWHSFAVIPIPLHVERLHERGFNQAELLARAATKFFRCSVTLDLLVRTRLASRQSELPARQRWQNVADVFAVVDAELVKDRCVLLIDDIYTTGATLTAAAAVLKEAGAAQVRFATIGVAMELDDMLDYFGDRQAKNGE